MGKIREGWELTKKSWALIRGHRELLRFPIYGAIAGLPFVAIVVAAIFLIDAENYVVGGIALVIGAYLTTLISFYFSVGLASTADEIFHGREATVASGLASARSRFGSIAGWAALSTAVGLVIAALEYFGRVGEVIVGLIIDGAWSLITFLAVPVIAFEGPGAFGTLKRSASLFRERWVGQLTGNVAIGGIVFLVGFLPAFALVAVGAFLWISDPNGAALAGGGVLVAIGCVIFLASSFIVRAMRGVFGVALYRYASTGETTATFTKADLESAVRTREAPGTA